MAKSRITVHEAGHLVLLLLKDFRIRDVSIAPSESPEGARGSVRYEEPEAWTQGRLEALGVAVWGGAVAEEILLTDQHSPTYAQDLRHIFDLAQDHGSHSPTHYFRGSQKEKARALLSDHEAQLDQAIRLLERHPRIEGEFVHRMIPF